jgi:hypothetical protein
MILARPYEKLLAVAILSLIGIDERMILIELLEF